MSRTIWGAGARGNWPSGSSKFKLRHYPAASPESSCHDPEEHDRPYPNGGEITARLVENHRRTYDAVIESGSSWRRIASWRIASIQPA